MGELDLGVDSMVSARILAAPPLNEDEAKLASTALSAAIPGIETPAAQPIVQIDVAPQPVLHLLTFTARKFHTAHDYPSGVVRPRPFAARRRAGIVRFPLRHQRMG